MATVYMVPVGPLYQALTDAGAIGNGYKLYTYVGGTVSTAQTTYTDSTGTVANSNPIILGSNGRFQSVNVWVTTGVTLKLVLTDSTGAAITGGTIDNVPAINNVTATGVPYTSTATGAVSRTTASKLSDIVSVKDFGATGDGSTDDTSAIAAAVASLPATGGSVVFPAGVFIGTMSIRRSNISIVGAGSSATILRQPAGALSTGGVIEVGDTASGNSATAYDKFCISGMTLDGNRTAATAPTNDLRGHGLAFTKITNYSISDLRAINCYNAGVGLFINSNFGSISCRVYNCGNATYTGPGFDINSSKYISLDVVSEQCYAGARVLDNCWGVNGRVAVYNATVGGFIYDNQNVNESYSNNLDVAVVTCGGNGFTLGANCRNSTIRATIISATGAGFVFTNPGATYAASNNVLDICTRSSGQTGLLCYGNDNFIRHQSYLDGRSGAQGSYFAVDVYGNRNKFDVDLIDSAIWQVRGIAFRAGATDNDLRVYSYTNTADPISDSGTSTFKRYGAGKPADIASASGLTLPFNGTFMNITGTVGIATINSASTYAGRAITLRFNGAVTVTHGTGSNAISLSGAVNFAATANDTLTLISDGSLWAEIGRAVI